MAVAELPPSVPTSVPPPVVAAPVRALPFQVTLEHAAYLTLFALTLVAHLWGLGVRAYHHDETHHAFFSFQLYQGRGYVHDPLLHGPFLYYANALVYLLFGDNNVTARLSVALFGSVLVLLPFLIRRELGRGAALMAAAYLAFSPVFLYVGRFIRHDPFAVVFELLALIGVVRYVSTRQSRWLYLIAAALGLMCVNMESFYLYVALMLPLVVGLFLWRIWKPGLLIVGAMVVAIAALMFVLPGEAERVGNEVQRANGPYVCPSAGTLQPPANPMVYEPGPLLGLPPLPTADNAYGLCVRHQPDNNLAAYLVKLGQFFGHPSVVLSMISVVGGLLSLYLLIWRRKGRDNQTAWQRARATDDDFTAAFASLSSDGRLLWAIGIFFAIYALFFSAFLTNPVGILSGIFGSVLYWLAQHDVQRGGQPGYYYTMLLTVYEPLALSWSIVGVALAGVLGLAAWRRRGEATARSTWNLALPALLVWWSAATLFIYSWAGEKMPWLTMHVALPLVFLAAWAFSRTLGWSFAAVRWPFETNGEHASANNRRPALLLYLGVVSILALFGFVLMSVATNPAQPARIAFPTAAIPLVVLVLFLVATATYALLRGVREAVGAFALATVLLGGAYTLRSSLQLNYLSGDTPREMLIFVQSSPDVAQVMTRLEQASIRRTGGLEMPIWYDNETIWSWYTRRFTNRVQQQQALPNPPGEEVQAVLMLQENINTYPQNLDRLEGFVVQKLPLRWWFPEDQYRLPEGWQTAPIDENSPLLMRALRQPFDSRTSSQMWQYMMYRTPPGYLGSTDFVIAVRPELAEEIGLGLGAE